MATKSKPASLVRGMEHPNVPQSIELPDSHEEGTRVDTDAQEGRKGGRKAIRQKNQRRYNLILPDELYTEVQHYADKKNVTVIELLRRFIKLGLLVAHKEHVSDTSIIIREYYDNGSIREKEIVLV